MGLRVVGLGFCFRALRGRIWDFTCFGGVGLGVQAFRELLGAVEQTLNPKP